MLETRYRIYFAVLLAASVMVAGNAAAAENSTSNAPVAEVTEILVKYFIIAVVFEIAMNVVFEWRVFVNRLAHRGVRTPILIVVAFLLVQAGELDLFRELFEVLDTGATDKTVTRVLTALLIAGGGASVHQVFRQLGLRNPLRRRQEVMTTNLDSVPAAVAGQVDLTFDLDSQTLSGLGGSWSAVSGTDNIPAARKGTYIAPPYALMVGTEDSPPVARNDKYADKPYLDGLGFGWFLYMEWVNPSSGQPEKGNYGIHPDGNVPGTEGCIGIRDADTRDLFERLKERYRQRTVIRVR